MIAAYESGKPITHVTLAEITARCEEQENPFAKVVKATRVCTLLSRWMDAIEQKNLRNRPDISIHQGIRIIPDQLAVEMTATYEGNYQIVEALSRKYGFDYFFFAQPHLAVGEKPLTKEEQAIVEVVLPQLAEK